MSKIIVLKGGRADNNMANMSASILRELVASILKVKATSIRLSGEISPEASFTGNTCWSSQTTENYFNLWGFNSHKGLIDLSYYCGNWNNATDGTQHGQSGTQLCDIPEIDDFLFFVVKHEVRAYDEFNSDLSYTLYKAPNFQEHWNKVEKEDIARWEQWLAE